MKDKFAVVTGTSTGIGKAVAIKLAMARYHVFLVGRTQKIFE